MRIFLFNAVAFLLITFGLGCSSGEPEETTKTVARLAATTSDVSDRCQASADRNQRCSENPDNNIFSRCMLSEVGLRQTWDKFLRAETDCLNALACNKNGDSCTETALNELNIHGDDDPVFQGCIQRHQFCGGFPETSGLGTSSDDNCPSYLTYYDGARTAFQDCLGKPCNQLQQCLDDIATGAN